MRKDRKYRITPYSNKLRYLILFLIAVLTASQASSFAANSTGKIFDFAVTAGSGAASSSNFNMFPSVVSVAGVVNSSNSRTEVGFLRTLLYLDGESCQIGLECKGGFCCSSVCRSSACPSEEAAPSAAAAASGGGGGAALKVESFAIDKEIIKALVKQGSTYKTKFTIKNDGTEKLSFNLDYSELENFVLLSDTKFTLAPNEAKDIDVTIFASETQKPDVYTGNIRINAGSIEKALPVIIEVQAKKALFDISVNVLPQSKNILKTENVIANITLINVGDLKPVDVQLYYAIRDIEGNDLTFGIETLAIYNEVSRINELELPPNISFGIYIFYGKVSYGTETAAAGDIFYVVSEKPTCFDGRKNQDEIDSDCGGACKPCESKPAKFFKWILLLISDYYLLIIIMALIIIIIMLLFLLFRRKEKTKRAVKEHRAGIFRRIQNKLSALKKKRALKKVKKEGLIREQELQRLAEEIEKLKEAKELQEKRETELENIVAEERTRSRENAEKKQIEKEKGRQEGLERKKEELIKLEEEEIQRQEADKKREELENQSIEKEKAQKLEAAKQLESEFNKKGEEISQLSNELKNIEDEIKSYPKKISEMDEAIKDLGGQISQKSQVYWDLSLQKDSASEKYKRKIAEIEENASGQKTARNAKIMELNQLLADRQSSLVKEMEKELGKLSPAKRKLIEKWKRLELKAKLKIEEQRIKDEIKEYDDGLKSEKIRLETGSKSALRELIKSQTQLKREIEDLSRQKGRIQQEKGMISKEIEAKKNDMQELKGRIQKLSNKRNEIMPHLSKSKSGLRMFRLRLFGMLPIRNKKSEAPVQYTVKGYESAEDDASNEIWEKIKAKERERQSAEKPPSEKKSKEEKPEKKISNSKKLAECYEALSGAKEAIVRNDIPNAKKLYENARNLYIGLGYEDKKKIYNEMLEFYEHIRQAAEIGYKNK